MIFTDNNTGLPQTTPPPLIVYQGVGLFILKLDTTWTFPIYVNWDLQYAISDDNITYSPYQYFVSPTTSYYTFTTIDPFKYYKFIYLMRSKTEISEFSEEAFTGKVKVALYNQSTGAWYVGEAT